LLKVFKLNLGKGWLSADLFLSLDITNKDMKKPKFKVGDAVTYRCRDLYGNTSGKIVEGPTRLFRDETGLCYLETDLPNMRKDIKWEILEGPNPVLKIYPHLIDEWCRAHERMEEVMSKVSHADHHAYCYTAESKDMRTAFMQKSLKKVDK
jgi:hypothetical protein